MHGFSCVGVQVRTSLLRPQLASRPRKDVGGWRQAANNVTLWNYTDIPQEEKEERLCVREHVDHEQTSGFSFAVSNSNQTSAKEGKLRVHQRFFFFPFQHWLLDVLRLRQVKGGIIQKKKKKKRASTTLRKKVVFPLWAAWWRARPCSRPASP